MMTLSEDVLVTGAEGAEPNIAPANTVPNESAVLQKAESAPVETPLESPSDAIEDWRARIAKGNQDLAKQLERFADETALAQSWMHAQKTISSGKKVELPQADWNDDQWAAFYDRLGRPKDPAGYKVKLDLPEGVELPEETKSVLGNVTQAGHKLGLTPQQMQGVHEFVANLAVQQLEQSEKAIVEQRAQSERALKELWGPEYQQNLRYAQAAVNQLHRETGVDWQGLANLVTIDGSKLGDRSEFVRLMAAAGRALGADPLMDVRSSSVAQTLEDRKRALMALRVSDQRRYASQETQDELAKINMALSNR